MNTRIRTMAAASTVAIASAGGAYGAWAILNAILDASPLTKFLVGVAALSAGTIGAYLSIKGE